MAQARYVVGIDLGTTHTVVAYADTGASRRGGDWRTTGGGDAGGVQGGAAMAAVPAVCVFEVPQLVAPGEIAPRPLLPSVRYHAAPGQLRPEDTALPWRAADPSDAPVVVGELARRLGTATPGRMVASAKSWLSHAGVDRTADILPWGAAADVPRVSPVAASASYLAHVAAAWDHAHPHDRLRDQEVVLTVPASFDEAARALTLQAARDAGLREVRLVEEPQAAFYHWLDRHRDDVATALGDVRLVLVVDVGGGTTDLTLIQVELRESGPRLTRIAVGEHLMLGGDNMDLALARRAEQRLAGSVGAMPGARFSELVAQCRQAKELLLSPVDPPERVRVTVLGGGSRLVGGTKSTELTRADVEEVVLDGFFPDVEPTARPTRRRGGVVELGLPFAADPAVTRHLAAFLAASAGRSREALADRAPVSPDSLPVPDAVLVNGGVFHGRLIEQRLFAVLARWRGAPPLLLENDAPDLAVARGAVAYGLARRGLGLRIGGGSARSFHVVVEDAESRGARDAPPGQRGTAVRRAVCILPRGTEEGEQLVLRERTFALRVGAPVRFHLVSSTAEATTFRAGDIVEVDDSFSDLPPIAAVLSDDEGPPERGADRTSVTTRAGATPGSSAGGVGGAGREVRVRLAAALTEIGTLELSCIDETSGRRWKLEMGVRGETERDADSSATGGTIGQLPARFAEAVARVHAFYGKRAQDVDARGIKTLRADLEKILGPREEWTTPLLRELFGALLAGARRRRRSADHERVWFNLVGYCLRPGTGYPLDEWRVGQLWELAKEGVQFAPEARVWSEWWTMWRRVAGGLPQQAQETLLDMLEYYLRPPSPRPRPRPKGPRALGYDDMVRLAGALERLPTARKVEVGDWLTERLERHGEARQTWWAVGRIGARVPLYGSAHQVVPREAAMRWLALAMREDWHRHEVAALAAAQLARCSGDRERDLPEALRLQVAERLTQCGAPPVWATSVREPTLLAEVEERSFFGDSLPPGLVLVD